MKAKGGKWRETKKTCGSVFLVWRGSVRLLVGGGLWLAEGMVIDLPPQVEVFLGGVVVNSYLEIVHSSVKVVAAAMA